MPQRRPQRPLLFVCCVLLLHLQQVQAFDDFLDDIVEVATDLWDAGVDFFQDVLNDDDDTAASTTLSPTAVPTDPILGQQAAACSANSACMVFPGNCCPNELGQFIACCDGVQPTNIISNLVLFEQGTPLDGYVLDLRTVDISNLYFVAIIQPELLIEAVRFTLGPFPPLIVGPRDGVFVLGPLRLAPFPLDDIMENGTYTVTAVALDAMGKEAGNTFTTDITVEGVGALTTTASPTLTPTTTTTTSTTVTPTTLQPTTDVPTGAPMAFPTVPRDTPFTLNPTVVSVTDAPTAFRPVSPPPVFPTNPPVTGTPTSIPTTSPVDPPTPFPTQPIDGQQVALCSAFPNCLAASLSGNCCPNSAGVFLDCCRNNGPVPTNPPTDFPTGMPVEAPVTSPPTFNPTAFPTGMPVEAPVTSPPTQSPTDDPTSSPTARPTGSPTSQPTSRPTTPFPTGTPTFEPTRDPIANPTAFPTLNPTNEPTVRITAQPTSSPTRAPTSAPTTSPTAGPTFNPTSTPTTSPTAVPTVSPSLQPSTSFAPTDSPAPSAAPTPSFEFEKQSFLRENVEMTFLVASLLRRSLQTEPDFCTQLASNRIQQLIDQEVKSKIVSFERVLVSILNPSRSSTESLTLDFDVLIEIRSVVEVTDTDIKEFIEGPFDTAVERDIFLEGLQEQDCFRTSTAVGVVVPAIEPRGPQTSLIGLIAGLAIAAIAIILLGILFIFLRARRHDAVDDEDAVTRPFALETAHPNGYANNDENENDIDISTLGDPIPKGEQANADQDQATLGSTSLEYDYKKAFQDQNSVTDSKVLGSMEGTMEGTSPFLTLATPEDPALAGMFGDAEEDTIGSNFTTEEQYEVVAPAGLLGLILESSLEDGRPTVNNVKATSVLASVVRIGDRLLSVDGQDVTKMSANEVSFLLATKKESPARVMLFGRSLRLLPEPGNDSISEVK